MSDAGQQKNATLGLFPYFMLGVIFLVLALVIRAPASIVSRLLPSAAAEQVSAWGGTLWQGQAAFKGDTPSLLEWQIKPWRMLTGQLVSHIELKGLTRQLSGEAIVGVRRWQLQNMQGDVPAFVLQNILPEGWQLPGTIHANRIELARSGFQQGNWTAATGSLNWQGGAMRFGVNGQEQQAVLPPLTVQLMLNSDALLLLLEEAKGQLATVRIAADGALETQLRERLLRYSPRYHGSGADPDTVVVSTRQAGAGK